MIIAAIVLSYVTTGLLVARFAYGWMRAKSIDGHLKDCYPRTLDKAMERWRDVDRVPAMMLCGVIMALWPAAIVLGFAGWLFGRFLEGTSRVSQAEHRDQLAQRDRRIAELEREAGIQ